MMPLRFVSMTLQSGSCRYPLASNVSFQNDVVCKPALATTISIWRHAFIVVSNNVNKDDHDWTSVRIYTHRLNFENFLGERHTFPGSSQTVSLHHHSHLRTQHTLHVGERVPLLLVLFRSLRLFVSHKIL